VQGGKDNLK